jgi:hypothetical protein
MNAYELAKIMEIHDGSLVWEHGLDIANMLRQQADRIADYEKWEKRWSERVARAENRIAELEKRSLDLCFSEAYANQATKVTEDLLLSRIKELELQLFKVTNRTIATRKKLSKLKKEKIRAYDNGYEDGRKINTN